MSHELNRRMLEVQEKLIKLDKSAKGDLKTWERQIDEGLDVLPYELLEAENYLNVLLEAENA